VEVNTSCSYHNINNDIVAKKKCNDLLSTVRSQKRPTNYILLMAKTAVKIFNICQNNSHNLAEMEFAEYTNAIKIPQFQHQ
jgi:hypothetical protein